MAKKAAASGKKSEFMKPFAAKTKGAWKKARETKGRTFDAAPGYYAARITKVPYGKDKNENPYLAFNGYLRSPDERFDRMVWSKGHFLSPPKPQTAEQKKAGKLPMTMEQKLERMAEDFQALGYETVDVEVEELLEMADELTEEKPWIKVRVTKNANGGEPWLNIVGLLDEEDALYPEDAEDNDGEDEEEEGDEDAEEEEIDGDEDEEEEEEDEPKASAKKRPAKKTPPKSAKKRPAKDEDEDDVDEDEDEVEDDEPPEDFDDEDEPEEDPPARKKAPAKKAPAKTTTRRR